MPRRTVPETTSPQTTLSLTASRQTTLPQTTLSQAMLRQSTLSRRARLVVLPLAAALVLASCGSKGATQTSSTGPITLGASMSLTGSLAREGQLTKEGYDLCARVVNAKGGVKVGSTQRKLAISYQDDTSNPDTAGALVDQFNDRGIKLILGPYGSTTTAAAAAVVERNGQVMMDSAGADDNIFANGYRRTFAVLSPATQYAGEIVRAVVALAKPVPKTMVVLSADDGFSKTAAAGGDAAGQAAGLKVLPTQFFPSGTSDVSAALTKVKSDHPDLIIGSVHLAEGVAIVKQGKELGVRPSGGIGETVAPPTPDFVNSLGPLAEGVLGSSQWVPQTVGQDAWFGTAAQYDQTFRTMFGGREAEYHNAEATAACLVFVLGIEKAGSTDPSKVRDAVASLDTSSFFGRIKFNDKGQNVSKPMAVIQIQHGKPVTIWPRDAAQGSLIWPGTGQ